MVSEGSELSPGGERRSDRHAFDEWDRAIQASAETAYHELKRRLKTASDGDPQRAILKWALARAEYELGQTASAAATMSNALVVLADLGDELHDDVRSMVLLSASAVVAEGGDLDRGLAILDQLADSIDVDLKHKVLIQRAYLLNNAGRLHEAIEVLDSPDLVSALNGDNAIHLRVRLNRGLVLLQAGQLERAEGDIVEAARIADAVGAVAAEALCHINLAVLQARSRRIVESLQSFERADALLVDSSAGHRSRFALEIDRTEVLIGFGMVSDALIAARRLCEAARPTRSALFIGDAMLLLARAELAAAHYSNAARTALKTAKYLADNGRTEMVAHARLTGAIATLRRSTRETIVDDFAVADEVVADLSTLGWTRQIDELALERIRAAWRTDSWPAVVDDLATLRSYRSSARRDLAVVGLFADAVTSGLAGDTEAAIAATYDGLDIVDQIAVETTSLDERCATQRLGDDLSRWLVETATLAGEVAMLFAAVEGTRARTLHELGEFPSRAGRHRQIADTVATRVRDEFPDRVAIQFAVAGARLVAVVVADHRMRQVDLGPFAAIGRLRDRVLAWIDQATYEPDGEAGGATAAANKLDAALFGQLGLANKLDDTNSVVVAPTPELFALPWSTLPQLAARQFVVTPSFRIWLDAVDRAVRPIDTVGFLAGPKVEGEQPELAALTKHYRSVDRHDGSTSTGDSLREFLATTDLVHVAAHGRFRADRPMLSTLMLADGQVPVHEVLPEALQSRVVVLSSCEGGAHAGTGGSEVLGLASVLLARGAASVVAPLTAVRDLECAEFVADFHQCFAGGLDVAASLAAVRSRWLAADDLSRWAVASSFTCFGAGESCYRTER